MTSFSLSLDKRRRTYVRLIGEIQHALHKALAEEFEKRKLTRTGMADALGTDKSFVTRKLNGTSNMTLETLADLAYALDRVVKVQLVSRSLAAGSNYGLPESAQFPTQAKVGDDHSLTPTATNHKPFGIPGQTLVGASAV